MDREILYLEDFAHLLNGRSGHIKTFCPFCHEQRSNKRDKSLSIDTQSLAYKCHYCDASGYLKSRLSETLASIKKDFRPMKKDYKLPQKQPNIQSKFEPSFLEFFTKRGINEGTLLDAKVTKETEFMPQDNAKRGVIAFNYFLNGELVNVKYRTRDKHFKFVSGARVIPYNIDSISDEAFVGEEERKCIITEGECFDEEAQVLTSEGEWKKIKDLDGEENVAQWESGKITFAKPLAIVKRSYEGDLVEYTNERRNYYSLTTPLHNLVVCRNGVYRKMHANEIHSQINIPRNGYSNGSGIDLSDDMLRLLIAISADFTIREKGDLYAAFKKQRKIERIEYLLKSNNIRYAINRSSCDGYTNVFIHRKQIDAFKEFPNEWIYLATQHQIEIILDELVFWDGNKVNNRTITEYSTKLYHNAIWVQTICHLGGMTSTIIKRKNDIGEWYKVSMLHKEFSSISGKKRVYKPYTGFVYCCTMPCGTLLVRQNECITISGNCDALTYIECGYKHVISVPAGANTNLEWIDDFVESHFDKLSVIYISVDNDSKGTEAKNELIRRFGAEMCKVVEYPKPCKDINEVLVQYGREKVKECITNAVDVKINGIQGVYDIEGALDDLFHNGLSKGAMINEKQTDKILSFNTGMLTVVTGVPTSGKTYWLNYILIRLNIIHDWKVAFFSPEFYPVTLHISQIMETLGGSRFNANNYNPQHYELLKEYVSKNFFWIDPNDTDINSVLDRGKYLIRKKGIKAFVIDPFNALTDKERKAQKQDEYISDFLQKIRWFARKYNVAMFIVMHPVKQQKLDSGLYPVCDLYSCKGASEIYDKADIGITVWRNEQENYGEMHVTKMKFRHLGDKGHSTFRFNMSNGRYVEVDTDAKGIPLLPFNETYWDNSNYVITKLAPTEQRIDFVEPKQVVEQPKPQSPYEPITEEELLTQKEAPF